MTSSVKYVLLTAILVGVPLWAGAVEPGPRLVVGAGAHFSWFIFDRLKGELEQAAGVTLELHGEGSLLGVGCNAGIKTALKTVAEYDTFGFTCCPLSPQEIEEKQIVVHRLAYEPIMILVHWDNPVDNLSQQQVRDIFSGAITNWKEVGGEDKPILVVGRLHCKKRPGHWKTILKSTDEFAPRRINVKSARDMARRIAEFPNAIGHIGSTWLFDRGQPIKVISVDGRRPTAASLRDRSYPFFRELSAVTRRNPPPTVKKIIQHVKTTPTFSRLADEFGLLPINE